MVKAGDSWHMWEYPKQDYERITKGKARHNYLSWSCFNEPYGDGVHREEVDEYPTHGPLPALLSYLDSVEELELLPTMNDPEYKGLKGNTNKRKRKLVL